MYIVIIAQISPFQAFSKNPTFPPRKEFMQIQAFYTVRLYTITDNVLSVYHSIHPRPSRFPGPFCKASAGRKKNRRTEPRAHDPAHRIEGRRRTSNGRNGRTTETEERKHKSRNGKADNHSRPHQRKRKDKPAAPSHKRENKTPSPVSPQISKAGKPRKEKPASFFSFIYFLFFLPEKDCKKTNLISNFF